MLIMSLMMKEKKTKYSIQLVIMLHLQHILEHITAHILVTIVVLLQGTMLQTSKEHLQETM